MCSFFSLFHGHNQFPYEFLHAFLEIWWTLCHRKFEEHEKKIKTQTHIRACGDISDKLSGSFFSNSFLLFLQFLHVDKVCFFHLNMNELRNLKRKIVNLNKQKRRKERKKEIPCAFITIRCLTYIFCPFRWSFSLSKEFWPTKLI